MRSRQVVQVVIVVSAVAAIQDTVWLRKHGCQDPIASVHSGRTVAGHGSKHRFGQCCR